MAPTEARNAAFRGGFRARLAGLLKHMVCNDTCLVNSIPVRTGLRLTGSGEEAFPALVLGDGGDGARGLGFPPPRGFPPPTPPRCLWVRKWMGSAILGTGLAERGPFVSASSAGGATVRALENRRIGGRRGSWHIFLKFRSVIFKRSFT